MRSSLLAALTTAAAALTLLLVTGGGQVPRADTSPHLGHAPTHYSKPLPGLFPARDVWGQYERGR